MGGNTTTRTNTKREAKLSSPTLAKEVLGSQERAKRTWAWGIPRPGCRGPQKASSTAEGALTSERPKVPGLPHACFHT